MDTLGIVFSGRVRSALLCALAVWMLLYMATYNSEIVASYLGGSGFDATAQAVARHMVRFLPYYLAAAVVLRSLITRLVLFYKLRRHMGSMEYLPTEVLSPLEASLLAHGDFTFNGIAGALKDLELRGCISLTKKDGALTIRPANMAQISDAERSFIMALTNTGGELSSARAQSAETLLNAGRVYSQTVHAQLAQQDQLFAGSHSTPFIRVLVNTFLWAMLAVQGVLTWQGIVSANGFFHVGYPRYPINLNELLLALLGSALALAIIASGLWQRPLADAHGLKNWRYIAALRVFIEKTCKDRFYRDGKQIATEHDMRAFYPYALALGVERRFSDELRSAFSASNF